MSARLLKDPATVNSRVFVGHLQTEDMTKHELEEHFSKYGTVVGSLINRGFGFVQFEEEQSAQKAIQNENGAMFKGRRIDVRPAKKDNQSSGNIAAGGNINNSGGNNGNVGGVSSIIGGGGGAVVGGGGDNLGKQQQTGLNNQPNPGNNQFGPGNESFGKGNQNFGGLNKPFPNDGQFRNVNQNPGVNIQNRGGGNDQFGDGGQNRDGGNDQFMGGNQNRAGGNNQFSPGNQNRGLNNQFGGGNQNLPGGNQNRPGGNQIRNLNNQGGNQNQGTGIGGPRQRGTRGGKNRNKNRDNLGGNNFRDRSPIIRGGRNDDIGGRDWDVNKQGDRGRGGNFGRDSFNDSGNRFDDYKGPGIGPRDSSFGSTPGSTDYPPIAAEKNDCEIIVVNKALTEYAEAIEMRLKKMGLTVDLLFPNEDVPLSRVLGNIASRGCLYAVVVTPINQEHHSLTLNILHGLPQEHRNMPVEDSINLISRDFNNYRAGGRSVPLNTPLSNDRHPDAVQVLLNMLADNHQLTVLQYDRVIKYLEVKREEQVQVELGDAKDLPATTSLAVNDPKQAELQSRILNILNSNKTTTSSTPAPSPVPAPVPVPSANWGTAVPTTTAAAAVAATAAASPVTTTGVSPSPLLNDPTVQKALDSLLQGNLLKNIGDQQPAAAPAPLFAAFPNIGRF